MASPATRPEPAPRGAGLRGPVRLLRGWTAAVVATVLAAGSHTVAGSAAAAHDAGPHPLAWILTLALAAPLCTALAGRALSWWRLLGAVGSSQLLFHWFYSVAAPSPGAVGPGLPGGSPTPGSPAGFPGHAGHAGHDATAAGLAGGPAPTAAGPVLPAADPAALAADHATAGMIAAHLVAALVTVLLLRRGERLAARVVELAVGLVLRAPGARLARWTPTVPVPRVPSRPLLPVPGPGIVVSSGLRRRGPPVPVSAC